MISRFLNFYHILRGSLWFVPAIICVFYFCATIAVYLFETSALKNPELSSMLYNGTTEDAKALIGPLMSSMITMATLAISITMVVLSLAASQLGPRIIKSFMSDRKTQVFMGLFLGAVVACFVLTRILHDANLAANTPSLTISLIFALCFANLFVLLAFVHHVAQSSIADHVITRISDHLTIAINRLAVDPDTNASGEIDDYIIPESYAENFDHVSFHHSGYIQNIDFDEMVVIAARHNLVVKLDFKAGYFMLRGEDGIHVWPKGGADEAVQEDLLDCIIIGDIRTPTQDIEYSVRHLVEIGLRAMSPGINDHFTAMTVLDHLSSNLAHVFNRTLPSGVYFDDKGKLRVARAQSDESHIIMMAFDQIRQASANKMDVTRHILEKIRVLSGLKLNSLEHDALRAQVGIIAEQIELQFSDTIEGKKLRSFCESVQQEFN